MIIVNINDAEKQKRAEPVCADDWDAHIRGLLRSKGFESMHALLNSHPAEPYTKLAQRLGIAGLQIIQLQYKEGLDRHNLRDVAADALAREIAGKLKRGWGRKMHRDFKRAHAYANWISSIQSYAPHLESSCNAVWHALLQLEPSDDWVPSGPNDPIIAKAFEQAWSGPLMTSPQGHGYRCPKCSAESPPPQSNSPHRICPHCGQPLEATG